MSNPSTALTIVKLAHTVVWAFLVACILAIWIFAWQGAWLHALLAISIVSLEVVVLAVNGWRCPLTPIAARYTDERHDNFDIYLPAWLARHNKTIFGALYGGGVLFTLALWAWPAGAWR